MLIIGLSGSWDSHFPQMYLWNTLRDEFKKKIPHARFEVERLWYSPWEGEKLRDWEQSLVKKYKRTREEIILVGYSMGGIVAAAMAPKLKNVRAVVTIFSPHTFLGGMFPWLLDSNANHLDDIPVISFGGWFDLLVLFGSKHPKAVKHVDVPSDHIVGLLVSRHFAVTITQETVELLVLTS